MVDFRRAHSTQDVLSHVTRSRPDYPLIISKYGFEEVLQRLRLVKHGALDFDGTVSPGSQWESVQRDLPEDVLAQEHKDRDWYFAQVDTGQTNGMTMDHPDWFHGTLLKDNRAAAEGAWSARSIGRYVQCGFTEEDFITAGKRVEIRDGIPELFDLLDQRVVISFGLQNVIEACLEHHGHPSPVAATRLLFDAEGRLTGFHPNVVVSSTKAAAVSRFLQLTGASEEEILATGDSVVDVTMMRDNSFNIWIVSNY